MLAKNGRARIWHSTLLQENELPLLALSSPYRHSIRCKLLLQKVCSHSYFVLQIQRKPGFLYKVSALIQNWASLLEFTSLTSRVGVECRFFFDSWSWMAPYFQRNKRSLLHSVFPLRFSRRMKETIFFSE